MKRILPVFFIRKEGSPAVVHFQQLAFLILLFFCVSCTGDFPKETNIPLITLDQVFYFQTGTTSGTLTIDLKSDLNTSGIIFMYPKWLDTERKVFPVEHGIINIPFTINNIDPWLAGGKTTGQFIIQVEGLGYLSTFLNYGTKGEDPDDGDPQALICGSAALDFGTSTEMSFTLTNPNPATSIQWTAENLPYWLQLSPLGGTVAPGATVSITCTINGNGILPGDYQQQINIISLHPQHSHGILVSMKIENAKVTNTKFIKWIEGSVTEAYYCNTTDYLYILTQKPNAILVKAPGADTLISYALVKNPNCMDVTKDGKTLVIGYNQAYVETFDALTLQQKKSYEIDCIPADIVFGENDWCYVAPAKDQWVYLYSLNLTNGISAHRNPKYPFYEKAYLLKMPGKPTVYSTNRGMSPGLIMVIDIANGAANDTIPHWFVETGGAIWFSNDGKKILTSNKRIYKLPEWVANPDQQLDLPLVGTIDAPGNYLKSLCYCEPLNCYFAAGSDYEWTSFNANTIYKVDQVSFSTTKSYKVGNYPASYNGRYHPPMDVFYSFPNRQGNRLYAIKSLSDNLLQVAWALEIIESL